MKLAEILPSYVDLVEPLFQYICKVNRLAKSVSSVTVDLAVVRADVESILHKMSDEANMDMTLSHLHTRMEKPLVYYVDSIIAQSNLTIAQEWDQNRLATIRWGDRAGDEEFFNLLEGEFNAHAERSEQTLAVFYLCLCLGFTGMYVGQPTVIDDYISRIRPRIRGLMKSDLNARICDAAYEVHRPLAPIDTRPVFRRPVSTALGWFALAYRDWRAFEESAVKEYDLPSRIGNGFVAIILAALFILYALSESPLFCAAILAVAAAGFATTLHLISRRSATHSTFSWNELTELTRATSRSYTEDSDGPEVRRAMLDYLRRKFEEGVMVYRKRRKDIYSLPWYLVVGEAGSGKSEAIRHSGLQFPAGLSDPLFGAGGTINMDWWFTNHAVLLDTAGKMFFSGDGFGRGSEGNEFLSLLRSSRPRCPLNGLFLSLAADELIKDTGEAINKKASQVAQQLDRIQRSLDVRFPVYLLVTKSDFLTGFKEFFDGINDPLLQNQILGWSNQGALDDPVDPDAIERQLRELVEIIKRRRLAVLSAPGNLDLHQNRRLDCTDAMFAFPESLERLIPRLKRYLQIIFSSGEFSAKPVFLRGIYFTSSMQQNGDLDEALAEFLGVQVSELPASNVQETAKSYFLRDVFIEKAFREQLVTRTKRTNI